MGMVERDMPVGTGMCEGTPPWAGERLMGERGRRTTMLEACRDLERDWADLRRAVRDRIVGRVIAFLAKGGARDG